MRAFTSIPLLLHIWPKLDKLLLACHVYKQKKCVEFIAMHWFFVRQTSKALVRFSRKNFRINYFQENFNLSPLVFIGLYSFLFLYQLKIRHYEKFVNGFETCEVVCFPSFFERCICFPSTQATKYRNQTIFNIIWWEDGSTERSSHRLMVQCLF